MIAIEQGRAQVRAAVAFHSHCNINDIRLIASRVKCLLSSEEVTFPLASTYRFRPEKHVVKGRMVKIETAFACEVTTKGKGPEKAVFRVECKFETSYELRTGYDPSPKEIQAFKEANAIFNTWPFFREYLHSTVLRMGYPALSAPFLKLVPKPEQSEQKIDQRAGIKAVRQRPKRAAVTTKA